MQTLEYGFDHGRRHLQATARLVDGYLYITIPGSDHWTDWFTNFLACRRKVWAKGTEIEARFHRGWWYYAFRFYRWLEKEVDLDGLKGIFIQGHSMGGAVAVILAGFLPNVIVVRAFNAPTPFDKYGAAIARFRKASVERWWHWNDIVFRLPGRLFGYALRYSWGTIIRYGKRTAWFWQAHHSLPDSWYLWKRGEL